MNNQIFDYFSFWLGIGYLISFCFISEDNTSKLIRVILTVFFLLIANFEMIADNQKDIWRKLNETKDK